jgi:trk system potassium uptake protein
MNIVILGAGDLGSYLAKALSEEQHIVTLIDRNEGALSRFSSSADIATVCNAHTNWNVLTEIPNREQSIFIGMTGHDETNLIGSDIAKNLDFAKTIVRVSQRTFIDQFRLDYASLFRVDHFIAPELIVANKLLRKILHPSSVSTELFNNGEIQMLIITIPHNTKSTDYPSGVSLCLINRKGKLIFPWKNADLQPGDEVTFIGKRDSIDKVPAFFDAARDKVKSVFLCGGKYIARELCPLLEEHSIHVKIIESDSYHCKQLSKALPKATILNHNETDYDFYLEERVSKSDVFISATEKTEKNILAASLAQEAGVNNVFCLTNDRSYFHLLNRLDISHVLSSRMSVGSYILSILYGSSIVQVVSLYDNQAKMVQMHIPENCRLIGKTASQLSDMLPKDCVLTLSATQNKTYLPTHEHILAADDTVFFIATPANMTQLEKLFV